MSFPPLLSPHPLVEWWSYYLQLRAVETKVNGEVNKEYQQQCREAGRPKDILKLMWNAFFEVHLRIMLTSSVSFVLDFSRASTLAWRLFTDALSTDRKIVTSLSRRNKMNREDERWSLWQTLDVCSAPPHNSSDRELLWSDRRWRSRERTRPHSLSYFGLN